MWYARGGHRTAWESLFSASPEWVPRTQTLFIHRLDDSQSSVCEVCEGNHQDTYL